jgi:NitT/TauT family transport system substrate-binding protein
MISRRKFISGLGVAALPATFAMPAIGQASRKRFTMLLNTSVSGPQAWFYLAEDKGYLAEEGIEISFTSGGGAYTAAPRMQDSNFDFGYGDINSLIELAAANPGRSPVGVFAMFNASPSTIALNAKGPIKTPKDLEGHTIIGHSSDVALRTFGAFCQSTGIDRTKVKIEQTGGGFRSMADTMLESNSVRGVFGYVSTIASAMSQGGVDSNHLLRHFRFAQHAPDLYGSVLMASKNLMNTDRPAIAAVVRAFNRGVVEAVRDPEAAINSVMRRASYADRVSEMLRLKTTLAVEMAHSEGKRLGIGAVDPSRLMRSIELIATTNGLPRKPIADDIFTSQFLPPLNQRVKTLAS